MVADIPVPGARTSMRTRNGRPESGAARRERHRELRGDRAYYVVNDVLLGFALLVVAYPVLYIVSASFSSPAAVMSNRVWLFPVDFSLEGYAAVFENDYILSGYVNSLIYASVGTLVNVFLTILAAYPLSRKDLYGRNLIMFLFTFTWIFQVGIIPNYLLVKDLGLLNTRLAMILPTAIGVWNVIIARTYYQNSIPQELLQAAQIDGCTDIRFLVSIVWPLSNAITAVIALFYAVQHWNAFFNALLYLSDKALFPLQIVLRDILILNAIDPSMTEDPELMSQRMGLADLLKYSLIIVASLPVWIAYPFVQRFFVRGVMIGSIKG